MTKKIKTLIVEDEIKSMQILRSLIDQYCPEVEIIGDVDTVDKAINLIPKLKPELVFLDIALPDGDGFEILDSLKEIDFKVIFVTAYNRYAIKAFEFAALHYLLKPINHLDLQNAVKRYFDKQNDFDINDKLSTFYFNQQNNNRKLILPTIDGLNIIDTDQLVRCEASHNYTFCFLTENRKILVSKSLSNFEKILEDNNFVRIHSKHLINLQYVKKYIKGQGGCVIMHDQEEINVSKLKKPEFLEKLRAFAKSL